MIKINADNRINIKIVSMKHARYISKKVCKEIRDLSTPALISQLEIECGFRIKKVEIEQLIKWLVGRLRILLKGSPVELNSIISEFATKFATIQQEIEYENRSRLAKKPLREFFERIFNYDGFSSTSLIEYYQDECNKLAELKKFVLQTKIAGNSKIQNKVQHISHVISQIVSYSDSLFIDVADNFVLNEITQLNSHIRNVSSTFPDTATSIVQLRKSVISYINKVISKLKDKNEISIYNYFSYRDKYPQQWSAYHFVMELDVKVCPYCNRNYIHPYYSSGGKTRADLDHFYPKSKYPFLALSFFNLVPSCKICNSSFKGSKNFSYLENLNPYDEGFNDDYTFTYRITSANSLNNPDDIQLDLVERAGISVDLKKRISGNIEAFKLDKMYLFHRDLIIEMINKREVYSDSWIDDTLGVFKFNPNTGKGMFNNRQDVIDMIFSNFTEINKHDKRILSKLTRDIAKELKFI